MSSWDRTQIPKPFGRVAMAIGAPIDVPDTGETTMKDKLRELEMSLAALEARAVGMLHRP